MNLKVKQLDRLAIIPGYAKLGDAGLDLYTLEDTKIPAKSTVAIRTGLAFEIEEGYEMQVRPRSGISLNGVKVLVAGVEISLRLRVILGTIDSGYRGEVCIITENPYDLDVIVKADTKLAQGVINKIERVHIQLVDELTVSERGEGGFGSTGIN